jgi:hypothetical protein
VEDDEFRRHSNNPTARGCGGLVGNVNFAQERRVGGAVNAPRLTLILRVRNLLRRTPDSKDEKSKPATAENETGLVPLGRPTGDKMTDVPFKIGDRVKKRSGYEYPGFIVSVFTNRAGALRYVVEADHPAFSGMLHIFNGDQLETR